jgi:hypothetical protein
MKGQFVEILFSPAGIVVMLVIGLFYLMFKGFIGVVGDLFEIGKRIVNEDYDENDPKTLIRNRSEADTIMVVTFILILLIGAAIIWFLTKIAPILEILFGVGSLLFVLFVIYRIVRSFF